MSIPSARRSVQPYRESTSLQGRGLEKAVAPRMMSMTPHNEVYVKPLRKTFTDNHRTSEYATMYSDSGDAASIYDHNERYSTAIDYKNRNTCYPLLIRTGSDDFQALLDLPTPDEFFKDSSPPESPLPYIHPLFQSESNDPNDSDNSSQSDDTEDDSSIRTPPSPFQMDQIDLSCSLFGTAPRRNVARPNPLTSPRMNHSHSNSGYSSSEASTDISSGFDREAEESNDDSTATSPTDIDASSVLLGTSAHYGRPLQWEAEPTPTVAPTTQHPSHYFRDKKYDLFPELAPQPPKSAGRDSPGKEGRLNVTAKQPKWYSMNAARTANARQSLKGYVNKISNYVEERREVEKEEKPQPRMTEEPRAEVPRVMSRRFTGPMGPLNSNSQHPIAEEDDEDTQELDEFHAQLLTSTTSSLSLSTTYSHGSSRDKMPVSPPPNTKKHTSMHWQLPAKSALRSKKSESVMDRPQAPIRASTVDSSAKKHVSVSWKLPARSSQQPSLKISSPMVPHARASAPPKMQPVYSKTPRPSQPTYSKTPRPQAALNKRATLPSLPPLQTSSNPVKGVFSGAKKRLTIDDAAEKRREEIRARIKFVGSVNPHLCKPQPDPWSP